MKGIGSVFFFLMFAAGAALARTSLYLAPADVIALRDQFAGQRVSIAGVLHPGSDPLCLSLGEGQWSGRFALSPIDSNRIAARVTALSGRFVIIEGVLRVDGPSSPVRQSSCSSAHLEGITLVEATP